MIGIFIRACDVMSNREVLGQLLETFHNTCLVILKAGNELLDIGFDGILYAPDFTDCGTPTCSTTDIEIESAVREYRLSSAIGYLVQCRFIPTCSKIEELTTYLKDVK